MLVHHGGWRAGPSAKFTAGHRACQGVVDYDPPLLKGVPEPAGQHAGAQQAPGYAGRSAPGASQASCPKVADQSPRIGCLLPKSSGRACRVVGAERRPPLTFLRRLRSLGRAHGFSVALPGAWKAVRSSSSSSEEAGEELAQGEVVAASGVMV